MSPTIVFNDKNEIEIIVGSPGGSNIIQYVVKSLVGVVDWKLEHPASHQPAQLRRANLGHHHLGAADDHRRLEGRPGSQRPHHRGG